MAARGIDYVMSYRQDSEVYVPYGQLVKKPVAGKVPIVSYATKQKKIAWFVSNCKTNNKRERVAAEIAQYFPLDVYGKCGNHSCPMSKFNECHRMVEQKYMFYLSFENSHCKDYVTEKLFKVLNYNVIPIVYGAADYATLMPKNSYIDVANFTTTKHLTDYLDQVANNEQMYKSYFDWKRDVDVISSRNEAKALCEALHNTQLANYEQNKDLTKWWFDDANCKLVT